MSKKPAAAKTKPKAFAELVKAESELPVKQQISLVFRNRTTEGLFTKPTMARTAVLNLAAAYEAGFIRARDIPITEAA